MTDIESEQIERAAELHRDRVAGLLDELRGRLSPGEIVDQVLGSMRDGLPQEFARNLGSQVRNNPLPVALIGAGMAWLMLGGRNGRGPRVAFHSGAHDVHAEGGFAQDVRVHSNNLRQRPPLGAADAAERAAEAARRARSMTADRVEGVGSAMSQAADSVSQTYEDTHDAAARTYEQTRDAAAQTYEETRDAAARSYDRARDTASQTYRQARGRMARTLHGVTEMVSNRFGQARETVDRSADQLSGAASQLSGAASSAAHATGDAAREAGSRLGRLAHEQPLVLAGIGIAIGAALASLFPVTDAENRLAGRTSDELKDRARELATEGAEKVQSVATSAFETATAAVTEAAQQEAARQGLSFGGEHGTATHEEPRARADGPDSSGDAAEQRSGESRDAADGRH